MTDEEKKIIIKKIDHCMAEHDAKGIDEILKMLIDDFENYDRRFLQIVLGYTGVFKKVLVEWRNLFDLIDNDNS